LSNLLLGAAVALVDDPLGGVIVSDGHHEESLVPETAERLNDSRSVWVVEDRRVLRRAMRLGARAHRCVCLKDYNRLLKQSGAPTVDLPETPQASDVLDAAQRAGGELRAHDLDRVAKLESAFLPVCEGLQAVGLPIDIAAWDEVLAAAHQRAGTARQELTRMVGRDLGGHPNIEPGERNKLLDWFKHQGFQFKDLSKSTLGALDHPAAQALLSWREASKLTSTYESYTERQVGGRVFGHFEPLGAHTGRMSCGEPNLQNIPSSLRPCVRAPNGRVLISADYSGCELRIVAALSGDQAFRETLLSSDFHSAVASRLFNQQVSKTENAHLRHAAKAINFGLIYGMGARRLAQSLEMSVHEARALLAKYFEGFPQLAAWRELAQKQAKQTLVLETVSGRKLKLNPEKVSSTLALNYPVQGGGADLIKWAAIRFARQSSQVAGRPCLVNMVHDELLVEVDADHAESTRQLLIEAMVGAGFDLFPAVPMAVDARIDKAWTH